MTPRHIERTLWTTAAAALVAAALGWRHAVPPVPRIPAARPASPTPLHAWWADSLTSAANTIVAADPFRLDRRPADAPYRVTLDGTSAPPPPPKPTKPALALAGIVGGPPWTVLLDGVPGREGTVVVHRGDTLGGLTIRSAGRDKVVVQGFDTTWTLTLKHPWP